MKKLAFLLSLILVPVLVPGQTPQKIIVDNNKVSAESIKPELQQIFPDFMSGRIHYKDNLSVKSQLNYNFLLDEILFINEKGEKMAIANPEELSYVLITDRKFIPSPKGYLEVIESGEASLVYKWICSISETKKEGVLGLSTDAPSVYQLNRFNFDSRERKMDVDKEAVAFIEVRPYLKVKSKYFLIKGEETYYKAFKGKYSEIKTYLMQNPVDYKQESDLRRLTKFCNSLYE